MIVVDTNVIAYLWLPSDLTGLSEKALLKDSHWISVPLWRSELRNVVALFMRKSLITHAQALEAVLGSEEQMRGNEFSVSSVQVLQKVCDSKCSAYDCEYAALAGSLNCPLITTDRQIIREFPDIVMSLQEYVS